MTDFIQACIKANVEIALKLKEGFDPSWYQKSHRGAGGDLSSGLDLMAEAVFVKYLSPFGKIESEESGIIGDGEDTIIIDPIDGSANALAHFPYYGTSIAKINAEGMLEAAVVCNLANGDIFVKAHDGEAVQGKLYENAFRPLSSSEHATIGIFEKAYANAQMVDALNHKNLKFRSPGAVALSLAYARNVKYVLFVGVFRIYDFAAGLALCEGLEVIVEPDYVIVSKEKEIAHQIEALLAQLKK
ncbi:MAG: inositol monophosphatase [Campylobacterales bacterium]|nr:inositol monophosphatase [Campylobacterales bacterium]